LKFKRILTKFCKRKKEKRLKNDFEQSFGKEKRKTIEQSFEKDRKLSEV